MTIVLLLCMLTACLGENIVVHIIPHSHTDPGWLTSYKGYYPQVRTILDRSVEQLLENKKRTFVFAEISFFKLWWDEQPAGRQQQFRDLLDKGRFEFLGGGWVMNDEALVTAEAVVNQMTEGHDFLDANFHMTPKVAWQIDPFGHSVATPMLYSQMGIENLIINRIDYREKERRQLSRELEFFWTPSPAWPNTELFTHVLHGHYSAPGFDFERGPADKAPFEETRDNFLRMIRRVAKQFRTNHILVPFGDDFRFQNATTQFTHMEELMLEINDNGYGIELVYSTPSRYFAAVKEVIQRDQLQLPTYTGDFHPYADKRDDYWTGFYTSRPAMKAAVRSLEAAVRAADIAYSFAAAARRLTLVEDPDLSKKLALARQSSALMQHHDTVTGTSSDPATDDSFQIAAEGEAAAAEVLRRVVETLIIQPPRTLPLAKLNASSADSAVLALPPFEADVVQRSLMLVLFNSLAWQRSHLVRLRVPAGQAWRIHVPMAVPFPGQVTKVLDTPNSKSYELQFFVDVPPLGFATLLARPVDAGYNGDRTAYATHTVARSSSDSFIENEVMRIDLDEHGGAASVTDKETGLVSPLSINLLEYKVSYGGAYLMRVKKGNLFERIKENLHSGFYKPTPISLAPDASQIKTTITKGLHYHEIRREHPRFDQIIRLHNSPEPGRQRAIEHELIVRAPPIDREVFVRFETSIRSGRTFFTDTGVEALRRTYDVHRPVHANVYPTPSAAFINDSNAELLVLSRQAFGVVSPEPGVLDVFVHRRLSTNDLRGLDGSLNDTSTAHIRQWLVFGSPSCVEQLRRPLDLWLNNPVRLLHGEVVVAIVDLTVADTHMSLLKAPMPLDKHVMTFSARSIDSSKFAVRVQQLLNHDAMYATPESLVMDSMWGAIDFDQGEFVGLALHGGPPPPPPSASVDFAPAEIRSMVATFQARREGYRWTPSSAKQFTWKPPSAVVAASKFVDEHVHVGLSWFGLLLLVAPFVAIAVQLRRRTSSLRRVAAGNHNHKAV
eukprot:TRINITY_DN3707_c0_g1_i2.p1 TRINITY_DN3707_c0_g1~~TRINITY_DN3707_c0_g1_i2.p1  ORF type:complete len:1008 (-),score=377.81 TRINITY_DN3707_c0_g1_i2:183-3206(-)